MPANLNDLAELIAQTRARVRRNPELRRIMEEIHDRIGQAIRLLEAPDPPEPCCTGCGKPYSLHSVMCPWCGEACVQGSIHDCKVHGRQVQVPTWDSENIEIGEAYGCSIDDPTPGTTH